MSLTASLTSFGVPGPTVHRIPDAPRPKAAICHGSPLRTAMGLRRMHEQPDQSTVEIQSSSTFPILQSYEQILGCIIESVRLGQVSLDDFQNGVESIRNHSVSVSRRIAGTMERRKSMDNGTPTAAMMSTPIQRRERSFSMVNKPLPLSFEDDDSFVRTERKWSMDTTSTGLPQSCTNERRLRVMTSVPGCSPTVACSPAPNIPLPPASPSTFSFQRPRTFSQNISDPSTPSPSQTPITTPYVAHATYISSPISSISFADISLGDVVGSGSFGVVHRARVNSTGQLIVVKVVPIHSGDRDSVAHAEALENELQLLQSLQHDRIVRYLGHERISGRVDTGLSSFSLDTTEKLVVFCEYMPGGSLASTIRQFGALDEKAIALHTRQIVEGLAFLHENRVCHRDLKCDNILIDVSGSCKLADFGCSKRLDTTAEGATMVMKSLKGTIPFMSPETLSGAGYGKATDIWALGCLILEMALGRNPWGKFDNIMQAMYRIAMENRGPDIPESLSDNGRQLVQACLCRDPKGRPSAVELLDYPFIKNVHACN